MPERAPGLDGPLSVFPTGDVQTDRFFRFVIGSERRELSGRGAGRRVFGELAKNGGTEAVAPAGASSRATKASSVAAAARAAAGAPVPRGDALASRFNCATCLPDLEAPAGRSLYGLSVTRFPWQLPHGFRVDSRVLSILRRIDAGVYYVKEAEEVPAGSALLR